MERGGLDALPAAAPDQPTEAVAVRDDRDERWFVALAKEWPGRLVLTGLALSAFGLLDPRFPAASVAGPAIALVGLILGRGARTRGTAAGALTALACVYAVVAWTGPDFNADSPDYYVYLRSAAFDRDLDFANEWRVWGYAEEPPTATGLRPNVAAVGSALVWSPFFAGAHVYVLLLRALGDRAYAADGFAVPYVRATALGTATVAVLGAFLLARALASMFERPSAVVGVIAGVLASPVPYYVLYEPTMAHGVVFGLAGIFLWAWTEAARQPSARHWARLGALLGLLALTRWQAIVYAALLLPLALAGLRSRRVRPEWIALSGVCAFAAFIPQLVAWKVIYGRFLALPTRENAVDWSSPHLLQVLLSADRGLFAWTPLMAVGALGLVLLLRRWPLLAAGGLLVLAASAWINGMPQDWTGSDSFGARRFDLVVPLLAAGLAEVTSSLSATLARRPWLAPLAVAAVLVAWNFGLMRLYRKRVVSEAAGFDRQFGAQWFQFRRATEDFLERLGGPRARNVAYMFFVGEYFYWNTNLSGTIDMAAPEGRYLSGGWSPPHRRPSWPAFRWAYYPKACVRVPLENPLDLRISVTARAPDRLPNQAMGLSMNHGPVLWRPLPADWTEVPFLIPAAMSHPGENLLCVNFNEHVPTEEGEEGKAVSAAVTRIQLP